MSTPETTGSKPNNRRGLIVGLTGGIACGKSTVATLLERRGARVISADTVGHQLLQRGSPLFSTLIRTFGEQILDEQGNISRERLGRVVFQDASARRQLNAMTHPLIVRRCVAEAYRYVTQEGKGSQIAVIEAPLLFEAGMQDKVDVRVVVAASERTQIERLVTRARQQGRMLSETEARQRIQAQMPLDEKIRKADLVIFNDGISLQQLEKEVDTLWETLKRTGLRKKGVDEFVRSIV